MATAALGRRRGRQRRRRRTPKRSSSSWTRSPPSVQVRARERSTSPGRSDSRPTTICRASRPASSRFDGRATRSGMRIPVTPVEGGFAGVVDDEVLPAGRYSCEHARQTMRATSRPSRRRCSSLPFRLATELAVGTAQAGTCARHRRAAVQADARSATHAADFGRSIRLGGRLSSPGGNPLAGRDIDVAEHDAEIHGRRMAADRDRSYRRARSLRFQGAAWAEPQTALPLRRNPNDPRARAAWSGSASARASTFTRQTASEWSTARR